MKPYAHHHAAVARAMAFLFIAMSLFAGCKRKTASPIDPAFAQYITAFTSGTISTAATVRIRFAEWVVDDKTDITQPIAEELLKISPSIKGQLFWLDRQTLEFRPEAWMDRGKTYEVTLQLNKVMPVPENMEQFRFQFNVMKQHMNAEVQGISAYRNDDLRWMSLKGTVRLMDVTDNATVQQTIEAKEGNRTLNISWTHTDDPHIHLFTVDSIERKVTADSVVIKWNGKPVDAELKGEITQVIPALGDFTVFFTNVIQQPDQYVVLQFSDPLQATQNLEGLIEIEGEGVENFTIENNEVRLFPPYRMSGTHNIIIHPGVKNSMGYASEKEQIIEITFEEIRPAVEMVDETKVILPSTDGLAFPFRAVNLSAVDVRVIRVYENNVAQFLQVNDLAGGEQMKRVGRQVAKKTIQLNAEGNRDLAVWNTFHLALDNIIKTEPGAIYRIEIGFKQAYSLYHCEGHDEDAEAEASMQEPEGNWDEEDENEASYWDYYDDYYSEYYDEYYNWDFDWEQEENPCDKAYYKSKRPVAKNVLASDLGIIAKKGTDNSMFISLSDLKSTKAMADVEIEIVNYQQQVLTKLKTKEDGTATVQKLEGTPFLLIAKKGSQRGYLKLDGGHALSLSTFDVSGQRTEKGLKGFVYGERGVWRPGDSLHIGFILQDESHMLPANHPVSFELTNPRGQVVRKMTKNAGENGFYRFTTTTDTDAETGNYTANVRVGGAVFSKTLKVETIKPNRLKIAFDFGKENITALEKSLKGKLSVKWLHGATAKNLKATVTSTFTEVRTAFPKYTDYVFDDPLREFYAEEQVVFDGTVDANGEATVGMEIDLADRAPGMVNANFSVKVFEEGGDFSVDRFSIPYAPYEKFVGMKLPKGDKERGMLLTDQDHTVSVATVDANGKPAAIAGLVWKVYKVEWRWWWEQGNDELARYVGKESTVPIAEGVCNTTSDGKGNFKFQVKYPDWGRYLVRIQDENGGHATGQTVYIDWPGWAGRAERENPGGASMLAFSMDKEKYILGEECKVTFPSSGIGRALISIENGTTVIESHWVEAKKDQTTYSFKTDKRMAPNAYVNITLVQPHNQTANDLPIRLYGVMPLFVENPGSHLEPVITMKDELLPEKEFDVKVTEKTGKAMTYTLAIVDEGLLDLTRFKTPDPWNYFYAREALGVNTYDMYDQVLGAFGAKLEKLLSIGGDDEAGGKGKNRANRFKPVVMYAGPFTINANESKTHKFTMPNYLGSVRVMVVAGLDPAYGNAEKAVPVRKPLMVLASLPRVIGPGEEATLPVTVFAMDKKIKDVVVKVEPNNFFTMAQPSTQTITFKEPGDVVVNYSLKVLEKLGVGKVKVTVTSAGFTSTYEVELDVRNPNPYVTEVKEGLAEAGKTWSTPFDMVGMAGTNTATLEVSSIPAIDFGRRLKYLLDYPHGCVEQTTSGAFPQIFIADVMNLNEAEKKRASDNVKAAINKLAKFQHRSGGLVYWPGQTDEDYWCSSYVGHFMLEAKAKGYTLPSGFEKNWLSFQKNAAQSWKPQDANSGNYYYREADLVQAYRLYTLALARQPEMGAMNRLKEKKDLSTQARWRLAAAYALASQPEVAKQMIQNLPTEVKEYNSMSYTYGSNWRDVAMMIETLVLMDERTKAASLVKELAASLSSPQWYSTQSTAYSLLAISKFAANHLGKEIKYSYVLNGKTSAEKLSQKVISTDNLTAKLSGNSLQFTNLSKNLVYVRVLINGQPLVGKETPAENDLRMAVVYTDIKGKAIDITRMEQGTDFLAEVTVTHPGLKGRYDNMALSQVFPSGWEIINARMDVTAAAINSSQPEYQDFRDDRVYSYFDLLPNETKKFKLKLNATYLGRYYMPAVKCEAMYDHSIQARTAGKWVEVVRDEGSISGL